MMLNRTLGTCLVAAVLAMSPVAWAQESEPAGAFSNLSLEGGVDFTTHYFFRGILQENQGAIVQPYASLTIPLWEGDGFINNISATLGTWHSIHSGPSGGEGSSPIDDPTWWYEADLFGGVSVGFWENFTASVTYTAYISPNRAFDTVQDITFGLDYDDSGWWEGSWLGDRDFSLAPSFAAVVETRNEADAGNTVAGISGANQGTYFQFGLAPSFTLLQSEEYPITASFPLTLGLGDDYYEVDRSGDGSVDDDSTFGYVSVGTFLSMPLAFVPGGDWSISAGATFLWLGETAEFINGGDGFEIIGTLSLGVAF
jgi:hypothetical protein